MYMVRFKGALYNENKSFPGIGTRSSEYSGKKHRHQRLPKTFVHVISLISNRPPGVRAYQAFVNGAT